MADEQTKNQGGSRVEEPAQPPPPMLQEVDQDELKRLVQDEAMRLPDLGIAISGLAGRFPKSSSVNEFERNLYEGVDMISNNDESRFPCGLWGLPPRAGRLNELDKFDAEFFGYSPDDANQIDHQLRILYEVVYESILDAGVNPASLRGTNTGLFLGFHCNEFESEMVNKSSCKMPGYYGQHAARVAQFLDLRGGVATLDAACASGFVAFHTAVQAMREGAVEQAIACSVNVPVHPTGSFIFLQMQMLSPTGNSKFLDYKADGYVKSEACVSVFLQRAAAARRSYGSVLASCTSVDGYKSEGITFPSDKRQEELIRGAKEAVGVSTNHVQYLEAHGTGTPAGDPQEARAIANVYLNGDGGERRTIGPLLIGSVKTNMGHSEGASGLCALAKALLMLENEIIYKGLNFERPNANIEALKEGKLKFVDENTELQGRIIPLSCYGFGGSNVHVLVRASGRPPIEQEAFPAAQEAEDGLRLMLMFGRSPQGLDYFFDSVLRSQQRATRHCLSDDFLGLVDALSGAPSQDRLMNHRGYLLVDRKLAAASGEPAGSGELARRVARCQLAAPAQQPPEARPDLGRWAHPQECRPRTCNLVFPGLGCQRPAMVDGHLRAYAPFWAGVERAAAGLQAALVAEHPVDLWRSLTDPQHRFSSMADLFVSVVAYQLALLDLLRSQLKVAQLGRCVGHSLGEIAAASAAGLLDETQAIRLAYALGRSLDESRPLIGGRMLAAALDERQARAQLAAEPALESARLSCVNGPESVTFSGRAHDMDRLAARLSAQEVHWKQLDCAMALHNERLMDGRVQAALERAAREALQADAAAADLDLATSGHKWLRSARVRALGGSLAAYFAESLCKTVDFAGALAQLDDDSIALELGPTSLFASQIVQVKPKDASLERKFHYACLVKGSPAENQKVALLRSLGDLYLAGASLDLAHFYALQRPDCGRKQRDGQQVPQCRRQTPSVSSLFQWDHSQSHFVPKYPAQFSKSAAKTEIPIDIMQDRDSYLKDHCIEGRVLFPATGYLFLVWRVFSFTKRQIYDAAFQSVEKELVPVEFRNVRLMRAVILGNRQAQLYIHLQEDTGRFEVKEGGSVVADGYACSPSERPGELLYEEARERIERENLELTLNTEDVYKQFRVSGYDYGEAFRNIRGASSDGRRARIQFNGHFVALTDSILQTIFLAVSEYAPSGGLFLPTSFEYMRFQPERILARMRAAQMSFDAMDESLNTEEKRRIMSQVMERQMGEEKSDEERQADAKEAAARAAAARAAKPDCFFDAYCDPVLGVVVTDGIEMRGIKAMPAPRRLDAKDVLLESYQFVPDVEEPVEDEPLTRFRELNGAYARICDSMALQLLEQLSPAAKLAPVIKALAHQIRGGPAEADEIARYKASNLAQLARTKEQEAAAAATAAAASEAQAEAAEAAERAEEAEPEEKPEAEAYDMAKNGNLMLLSLLDQLSAMRPQQASQVKELVQAHRQHLMQDLLQSPQVSCERVMRPILETVIENCCAKRSKLRLLEMNPDDGLLKGAIQSLVEGVAPQVSLDYALAHPEPARLSKQRCMADSPRTHTLTRDLQKFFATEKQLEGLDLIVYKDISCYSLPKQVIEQNGLGPVLGSLKAALRPGGFALVSMRERLTLAERVLLSLTEPELVGLSRKHLEGLAQAETERRLEAINEVLESRCRLMLSEAQRNQMLCVARKTEPNGCAVLLFRRPVEAATADGAAEPLVLQVSHESEPEVEAWLEQLKAEVQQEAAGGEEQAKPKGAPEADKPKRVVWLCAVATRDRPVSGLVGMAQALSRELGADRLRCFYDMHTFAHRPAPIGLDEIRASAHFRHSLERDLFWNCVDERGQFGAYRHLTINTYMAYENCRCSKQKDAKQLLELAAAAPPPPPPPEAKSNKSKLLEAAFINSAARGDLSSFTWYQLNLSRVSEEARRKGLVKIAYSALNFRDIMYATGRLSVDSLSPELAMSDCLIGLEYSGTDTSGRRVAGIAMMRALATHIIMDPGCTLPVPDTMSLRDAATIPTLYCTVILALLYRGKIRRGESILIHAGSGGIGQAAINVAHYHGLTIYTTVGSQEKRDFLLREFPQAVSQERIFSSRDTNFETEIMRATRGRGVDLVLNSLADDKLQASIRCLADSGRFLEIGKYDLAVNTRLELLKLDYNKTFHGVMLDRYLNSDEYAHVTLEQIFRTLNEGFRLGYVKPIKSTVFKHYEIEEAFRFMATGKHMGKVLIEMNSATELGHQLGLAPLERQAISYVPCFQLEPEASILVTGGLGGFGLELVKWLVTRGARRLVITSRTGPRTGYQKASLRQLESSHGAHFLVVTEPEADASTAEGARRLCQLACEFSPVKRLGALFHLAMLLKDSLVDNMSAADFRLVCRPKLEQGAHLDAATRGLGLRHFVVFSSVSAGKGNAGQMNYAYANSYLERLCERRRRETRQHAQAIQWGAIGDVGVAFENLGGNDVIIGGTKPQRMPSCLNTLAQLLCAPFTTCLSVVPVNRNQGPGGAQRGDLVAAIMHVLGIKDQSKVSEQATLGELGLDSLMAVEIRQYIEREYDMTLNMQEIRALTIGRIREIGEKGKPAALAAAEEAGRSDGPGASAGPRVVDSYGSVRPAGAGAEDEALRERRLMSSMVPALELPQRQLVLLNACRAGTPLYFVPPIHGRFEPLLKLCARIERPCVGLHWSQELGRAEGMPEVVASYLGLLRRADLGAELGVAEEDEADEADCASGQRRVDLVGYSFGATVAFEMMLRLHAAPAAAAPRPQLKQLKPGRLVLLDGSPLQIEVSSQLMLKLTGQRPLGRDEKLDELLMVFMMAHAPDSALPALAQVRRELTALKPESKLKVASRALAGLLEGGGAPEPCPRRCLQIADSMEAFCRKYDITEKYKCAEELPADCMLIRAEKLLVSSNQDDQTPFSEDLGVSSVVRGRLALHTLPGDHESFLETNADKMADIIADYCKRVSL